MASLLQLFYEMINKSAWLHSYRSIVESGPGSLFEGS